MNVSSSVSMRRVQKIKIKISRSGSMISYISISDCPCAADVIYKYKYVKRCILKDRKFVCIQT